jgi:hypothetical protein
MCAARDESGSYALVYMPTSHPVTVDLGKLAAVQVNAWWFCPRSGKTLLDGKYSAGGFQTFEPPKEGPDWVLILDVVTAVFKLPGVR